MLEARRQLVAIQTHLARQVLQHGRFAPLVQYLPGKMQAGNIMPVQAN
jgi:hypothetical protein